MNTFSILYRQSDGKTRQVSVQAETESQARDYFYRLYDGRIISITG